MLRAIPLLSALALLLSSPSQAALVSAAPASLPPATSENASTAFLEGDSESRIGLLCHNDPVNKNDPTGLYVTYSDGWSAAGGENFRKNFAEQWANPEGRATWQGMYADPVREYKISPDRSTGSPEKGATGFKSDVTHHSLASFLKDLLPLPAAAAQGNSNFAEGAEGVSL